MVAGHERQEIQTPTSENEEDFDTFLTHIIGSKIIIRTSANKSHLADEQERYTAQHKRKTGFMEIPEGTFVLRTERFM